MNPPVTHCLLSVRARALAAAFCLVGCLAALPSLSATESFVFRDDFSCKDGAPLKGTRPAGASAAWQASSNLIVLKDDGKGAASPTNPNGFTGRVPLPAGAQGLFTMEATLRVAALPEKQDWVALGLGNPAVSEKSSIRWPQGVFVIVRPNGAYTLFLSPDGEIEKLIQVKSGTLPNIASKPVPVRLAYDSRAQTLSLTIDGKTVVQDYELANRNFTPTPLAAGFSGFGQVPGTASVSSFKVEIGPGR